MSSRPVRTPHRQPDCRQRQVGRTDGDHLPQRTFGQRPDHRNFRRGRHAASDTHNDAELRELHEKTLVAKPETLFEMTLVVHRRTVGGGSATSAILFMVSRAIARSAVGGFMRVV